MAVLYTQHYAQFFDNDGNPLANGKLYTYAAGTSTPKATYTTAAGDIANTNPVILDDAGRAKIFLLGSYKFVLTDSNDAVIDDGTTDNVSAFTTTADAADAFFQSFSGNSTQTAFTLSENLGTDEKLVMVFVNNDEREYVVNGGFATDTDWTKGSGWVIGTGVATATTASSSLEQDAGFTINEGQSYTVTYTITRSAGTIEMSIGGVEGVSRDASGTYTETIIAGSTQKIAAVGTGFTGTIDNISIKAVGGKGFEILNINEYTLNGTTLTIASPPAQDSNNIQVWSPARLAAAASSSAAQAEAAAVSAEAFKDAAEAAQIAAELAEANAETAEVNAEAAEVAAEAARDAAIVAAGSASVGNLNDLVNGAPVTGDFIPFVDVDDSNLAKKFAIGTSGATVPLLNGNNTFSGTTTLTTTGTTRELRLESTETDAGTNAVRHRERFFANNASGNSKELLLVDTYYGDATDGSEDTAARFWNYLAGALRTVATWGAGLVLSNATGGDQGDGTVNAKAYYKNGALLATPVARFAGTVSAGTLTTRFASGVSVTRVTDGEFTVTLSSPLSLAYPIVSGIAQRGGTDSNMKLSIKVGTTPTTTSFTLMATATASNLDPAFFSFTVFDPA